MKNTPELSNCFDVELCPLRPFRCCAVFSASNYLCELVCTTDVHVALYLRLESDWTEFLHLDHLEYSQWRSLGAVARSTS
jgi:hypothetical protein